MKVASIFTFLFLSVAVFFGKKKFVGVYANSFVDRIELKKDATFRYSWSFDLASSWTVGSWTYMKDTIYLESCLIFDSLYLPNQLTGEIKDTLVISRDMVANRIEMNEYLGGLITSRGQHRKPPPKRLLYRKNRLYFITENHQPDTSSQFSFWTSKKDPTYLKRIKPSIKQKNR